MAIQLGATYSDVLIAALQEGDLAIDYIKVDADSGMSALQSALAYRPVFLHDLPDPFWLNYENPFQEGLMLQARALLDAAQSPWLSTGIGASAEPQRHRAGPFREAPDTLLQSRAQVIANIVRHGRRLREWAGVPVLLENYNYHPTNAYEYVCEPEVVQFVLNETGCGLLLDLAHAQISGFNLRWPSVRSYIEALPLHKAREIHLNHPVRSGDNMYDMHQPIGPADLALLEWTLERAPAEAVTLEADIYDTGTLRTQIELLRRFLDGH